MLAGDFLENVQLKVTGPTGAIRKCVLTQNAQKSWLALESEIRILHGITGPAAIHYIDEDGDQILIDSDAELTTLLKWIGQTKKTSIKVLVNSTGVTPGIDQYSSATSMASFRTQDSFVGAIPAPSAHLSSNDSWRFKSDQYSSQEASPTTNSTNPQLQGLEYHSQPIFANEYVAPLHSERDRHGSTDSKSLGESKINSVAREAAYKAAIEANNTARRAYEESRMAAKANREAKKNARRNGGNGGGSSELSSGDNHLPPYGE
ncbi:hypothetical protein HK100_001339 [Physocladia obscura]|uniref:PB1 domain-containing protein n=1 Tax=Physocladia obscura TaxID=109957 RepID=A0AAD5TA25_9FUNG|nr:hypothetical protein HK100_001339 [Physocladia obscura]